MPPGRPPAPPRPGSAPRRPLVVASNRGPVQFEVSEDGSIEHARGGGGLVTGLTGALSSAGGLWVAAAMTDGDRHAAEHAAGDMEIADEDAKYRVRYLTPEAERFDRYYNVVSNRVLWFIHHYLFDAPRTPRFGRAVRAAWDDYVAVNREFADALAEEPGEPAFLVQDYHLSLAPLMLRESRPDALVAHFSHTPFAGPDYFRILPQAMGDAVLRGMLGADVLGFHCDDWAENFLLCCRHVEGARVDLRRRRVEIDGRSVAVRTYPIAIDAPALRRQATSPAVRRARRELVRWKGDAQMILRVDRTDLSKNILRGFLAYETLLNEHPRMRGRVRFLALLNPSRRAIPEYRAYTRDCLRAAERINAELGTPDWQPVTVVVRDDIDRAVAAYSLSDVLLVNPVFDGMNLVAMEGPTVNRADGVLVLSRNAGADALLGRHALSVNPFDVQETAEAMYEALHMRADERHRRAAGLRRAIGANPPVRWVGSQLADLERAAAARAS
ncbi:MAG TPA: trehalose-6-phosphate synthase [Actinomycetota bacterium]|nr:trehalose-6-phosphate synthase [Actinomycetota bacterium]